METEPTPRECGALRISRFAGPKAPGNQGEKTLVPSDATTARVPERSDLLLRAALGVFNTAISTHRYDPLCGTFLRFSEKVLADRDLGIAVCGDDPGTVLGRYTVQMQRGRFQLTSADSAPADSVVWSVSRARLARIVTNAREYVAHPMRLDWDWLRSLAGLSR